MKLEIKIDRVLLIFYLLALLAFPYYANSLYKWINMITTVIFFLFECRSLLKYRLIRNIIRKNQYISWLLIVAFLVMFASFWSEDLWASLNKAIVMWMTIIGQFAVIIWVKNDDKRLQILINIILVIAVIVFLRVVLITPFFAYGYQNIFSSITGYDKNAFSMMGAFLSINALYFFYKTNKKQYIFLWGIMLAMAIVGASRKGALIAIMAVPMMVYLKNKPFKKVFYVLLFVILAIVGIYFMMTNDKMYALVGQRLYILYLSIIEKGSSDGSLVERTIMIKKAIELFESKSILGWGTDGFAIQSQSFFGKYVYSHCNYTELLCNFGIVGFIIYYYYPVIFIINSLKKVVKHNITFIYSFVVFVFYIVFEYGFVSYYEPFHYLMKTLAVLAILCQGEKNSNEY